VATYPPACVAENRTLVVFIYCFLIVSLEDLFRPCYPYQLLTRGFVRAESSISRFTFPSLVAISFFVLMFRPNVQCCWLLVASCVDEMFVPETPLWFVRCGVPCLLFVSLLVFWVDVGCPCCQATEQDSENGFILHDPRTQHTVSKIKRSQPPEPFHIHCQIANSHHPSCTWEHIKHGEKYNIIAVHRPEHRQVDGKHAHHRGQQSSCRFDEE